MNEKNTFYVADSQYFRTSIIEQYVFHMRCFRKIFRCFNLMVFTWLKYWNCKITTLWFIFTLTVLIQIYQEYTPWIILIHSYSSFDFHFLPEFKYVLEIFHLQCITRKQSTYAIDKMKNYGDFLLLFISHAHLYIISIYKKGV